MDNLKEILMAILVILGGFSILAKVTPWQWDNKIIDKIQKIINIFGLSKNP